MADRARSAMMMPKIQAFVATFPASLKPRTQGHGRNMGSRAVPGLPPDPLGGPARS
jgi:hypothetical protein